MQRKLPYLPAAVLTAYLLMTGPGVAASRALFEAGTGHIITNGMSVKPRMQVQLRKDPRLNLNPPNAVIGSIRPGVRGTVVELSPKGPVGEYYVKVSFPQGSGTITGWADPVLLAPSYWTGWHSFRHSFLFWPVLVIVAFFTWLIIDSVRHPEKYPDRKPSPTEECPVCGAYTGSGGLHRIFGSRSAIAYKCTVCGQSGCGLCMHFHFGDQVYWRSDRNIVRTPLSEGRDLIAMEKVTGAQWRHNGSCCQCAHGSINGRGVPMA